MRTPEPIDSSEDVIDSRDIIERIDHLQSLAGYEMVAEDCPDYEDFPDLDPDEVDELMALLRLQDEADEYVSDWKHGEVLIRHTYFTEYTEELCKELGYIADDFPWWIEIDWEETAENVKQDYTELDFDGVAYYGR
jgi:hypothetical protein